MSELLPHDNKLNDVAVGNRKMKTIDYIVGIASLGVLTVLLWIWMGIGNSIPK